MHGTRAANYAMDEADLICAVGARFDDRITGKLSEFAPRAKFIHIDVDPAEISKNVPAHIPIVGDAKHVLAKLVVEYRALSADPARLEQWWERIEGWREKYPLGYEDSADSEIKPQYMIQALHEATGGEAIISSDVGQHQMWAAQYYDFPAPRRWINSGGLGTMGFGLPAAMGAAVGCPDRLVCCIAGDGSVQMNAQELATCAQDSIPIKVFIMNNGYLGHGAPVAGALLGRPLQPGGHGLLPRLGEARRGLWRHGHALREQDDARGGHESGPSPRRGPWSWT